MSGIGETEEKEVTKSSKVLAEEHWTWLETLLRKVFVDAFIHGYKHGKQSKSK